MFPFWVMFFKLSKKVHFLWFCTEAIKVIYIYASERSRYSISENGIVYYAMTYSFGDIMVWSRRTLLNFCWVSIFFDISTANTSWTNFHFSKYDFLKERNENFQIHICKLLYQTLVSSWIQLKIAKKHLFRQKAPF